VVKETIECLRPDVLVKGADYTVDTVVGAEFVMSYGGRVVLAELKPGHSTTNMIRRMGGRDIFTKFLLFFFLRAMVFS
jgi:D-beta-D-heptose 7-phosphate kinase/D-beta-D-heptose 1-phosphate adenosyltransferase